VIPWSRQRENDATKAVDGGRGDLFRGQLRQIIDVMRELALLRAGDLPSCC
jgi:hypothetical protein